jgi:Tol biopolymer transport system component
MIRPLAFVAIGLALAAGCGDHVDPIAPPAAPSFVPDLPAGTEGQPYDATLTVKDGLPPFTWDATDLPAGLSIEATDRDAHLTGTPPAGRFNVMIRVSDAMHRTAAEWAQLNVRSALSITGTLPETMEGEAIDAVLTVNGGVGRDYRWRLGDHAPANVHLGHADGRTVHLTGTAVAGTVDLPVIVEDAADGHAEATLHLFGYAHLELVTELVPNAQKGAPYGVALAAQGGRSATYVWNVADGKLPDGIALVDGRLSGTPTTLGHFAFTIAVSTSDDAPVSRKLEITVGDNPPHITTTTLPGATWGVSYQADVAAQSHANGAITWRLLSGTLPPGVKLDGSAATAHLAGTPRVRGIFTFTVEASDSGGSAAATFAVSVDRQDRLAVSAATLPAGRVGRAYAADLRALDAHGAVAWELVIDALPPGLTISNGRVTGTPTHAGWYRFTVKATDADHRTATRALAIGINRDAGHALAAWRQSIDQSTVRVVDVSQRTRGAETVLSESHQRFDINAFSPGGDFATYTTTDPATDQALYLVDMRGAIQQTRLSTNAGASGYIGEWSPDEHWLAWYDQNDYWYVTDLSDAAHKTEKLDFQGTVVQVFWSPDGSRLLLPTSEGALIWQSGRPLLRVPLPIANRTVWTADGNGIICGEAGYGPLHGTVYYVSLADPTPVALTPSFDLSSLIVAPDRGTLLASDSYGNSHTGDDTVYAVDLRDEQIAQVAVVERGSLLFPRWSNDGQRLLVRHSSSLEVFERAQLFDGGPTKLAVNGTTDAAWGSDADHLVYHAANGLYETSVSGGAPELIVSANADWHWLSPDRRVYLYRSGSNLSTVDFAAPSPRTAVLLDDQASGVWIVSQGLQSAVWWSSNSRRVQLADLGGASPASPVTLFDIPRLADLFDDVQFAVSP